MQRFPQSNRMVLVLCLNAIVLLAILLAMVSRDGRLVPGSAVFGQINPQTTSASGLTVMPGQLSPNTWGCYVLDAENQTLSVYEYRPTEGLKLGAGREIRYDRQLKFFNTSPPPNDIKARIEQAEEPPRVVAPDASKP